MKLSKLFATLSAGLVLATAAGLPAAQAATTLTMSSWVSPTHFLTPEVFQPWIEDVKRVTEGRVDVRILPKPVGGPAQHWELARKGIADITWGNFTYEPDRFKALWFSEMPFIGTNAEASSVALWETYEKYLAGKPAFEGVVMLGVGLFGGGQIHHGSKNIVEPDDLKNQKVRMGGPIQKRLLEDLGAVPVGAGRTADADNHRVSAGHGRLGHLGVERVPGQRRRVTVDRVMAEEMQFIEHFALAFDHRVVVHHFAEAKHTRMRHKGFQVPCGELRAAGFKGGAGHAGGNHNKNGKGKPFRLVEHILNSVRTANIRDLMRVSDDGGGAFF